MLKKIYFLITSVLILNSCNSLKNKEIGKWNLISEFRTDDPYATRSSLTEKKINSDKTLTLKKDSSFVSNLSLCNQWPPSDSYISKGVYHFKKNRNPDKLFWLECPGMYPDHHFEIRNKRLELHLPSVTGYQIQIFEKK